MFKTILVAILALATTDAFGASLNRTRLIRAVGDVCHVKAGKGTCQRTSNCKGNSYPQNLCEGGLTDVQCCVKARGGKPSSGGNLPGLDAVQSKHAHAIMTVAKSMDMPMKGCQVAMATALLESHIRILANPKVPASMDCPFDPGCIGEDHDSVGIFQQRVAYYNNDSDGDVCKLMNPTTSATYFFEALNLISGWESMPIGAAAQAVQRSEFPDRYQPKASHAIDICTAGY